ncbi:MAG TPA: nitronate monooxygenase, partial [Polyangiaceae bacterium]|nr:nitronate monooxygenase [Polyangiaceae bacterium]
GLGILGSATMSLDELENAIVRVKERTRKPFGVNLRSDQPDVKDRAQLMIREGVKVASFAQAPNKELIRLFKDAGIITMPTVGARRHAEKVAAWGVDAVIAQGHEGGGHTGPVATTLLLPQVVDAVDIPVVGAGGFNDGRGLVAALAYGASGIAMGTRFLLTRESHVPDAVKQRYLESSVTDTVVTLAIDGYPQRVILTDVIAKLEQSNPIKRLAGALQYALAFKRATGAGFFDLAREGLAMKGSNELTWTQVSMAATAPMMTKASMVDGRADVGILPTGQVVGLIDELPSVGELIERIMQQARATLEGLAGAKGKAA